MKGHSGSAMATGYVFAAPRGASDSGLVNPCTQGGQLPQGDRRNQELIGLVLDEPLACWCQIVAGGADHDMRIEDDPHLPRFRRGERFSTSYVQSFAGSSSGPQSQEAAASFARARAGARTQS